LQAFDGTEVTPDMVETVIERYFDISLGNVRDQNINAYIAGSSMAWIYSGIPNGWNIDLDLYTDEETDNLSEIVTSLWLYTLKDSFISDSNDYKGSFMIQNRIRTIQTFVKVIDGERRQIQIVRTDSRQNGRLGSGTPESVIRNFDLTVCSIGYNISDRSIYIANDVKTDMFKRKEMVLRESYYDRFSRGNIVTHLRIQKYIDRGFKLLNNPGTSLYQIKLQKKKNYFSSLLTSIELKKEMLSTKFFYDYIDNYTLSRYQAKIDKFNILQQFCNDRIQDLSDMLQVVITSTYPVIQYKSKEFFFKTKIKNIQHRINELKRILKRNSIDKIYREMMELEEGAIDMTNINQLQATLAAIVSGRCDNEDEPSGTLMTIAEMRESDAEMYTKVFTLPNGSQLVKCYDLITLKKWLDVASDTGQVLQFPDTNIPLNFLDQEILRIQYSRRGKYKELLQHETEKLEMYSAKLSALTEGPFQSEIAESLLGGKRRALRRSSPRRRRSMRRSPKRRSNRRLSLRRRNRL